MRYLHFSNHFRRNVAILFLFLVCFFSFAMGASAESRCPSSDDHALSAERYKMFTAYQLAYDGYQVSCEMKCFDRARCVESCQTKKALESLNQQLNKSMQAKGLNECSSLTEVCKEQCQASDPEGCERACQS
jgi:hypothetical protein